MPGRGGESEISCGYGYAASSRGEYRYAVSSRGGLGGGGKTPLSRETTESGGQYWLTSDEETAGSSMI